MKIVFRVDSSINIGSGHIMRCLVLADELNKLECSIYFACLPQEGDLISYVKQRGYDVVLLSSPLNPLIPINDSDYKAWLLRSSKEDALDFIELVENADIVITDHYSIGREWQSYVRKYLNCFIVAIDDLVREHDADLIIDQTLGRLANEYSGKARVLAGSQYAMLAPNFSGLRQEAISRTLSSNISPKVLVSMGGIDKPNATLHVLQSLVEISRARLTVLLSPRSPNYASVKTWCEQYPNVFHKDFEENMAKLMMKHDIAVGAPGTTSWERACLGLPSILIPLAENQRTICEQLLLNDAIVCVSLEDIAEGLDEAYNTILDNWLSFVKANLKLCDGLGVKRIAFEIRQLMNKEFNLNLQLVPASKEDIRMVYEWQCHPKTRQFSLTQNIPTWEEHQRWMIRKLQSSTDYFYLVEDKKTGCKLGVLRLDMMEPEHYLVSIYIAPDCHGQGVATASLQLADYIHANITLHATVLEANTASQHLFKKANYVQLDPESFIRYPIN
ncbi:UDP-2,4-diacetamido-2,4,6-trideoxy-beta-L-altropyranose hydrolase [Photobacterium damselae]|uniref:UDP-2,4-diacetamido-2,4, 6-trideoxy-beta-L-altropyranose hydrolase n=1 Tax=Photobacterium damselae TaxID=38293 RepID=UPI0012ADB11A|nr:UDP-2,4-diacetamido-2,4,6-trideoxy-beta-L-altropyranose hydrolase [Photobacterium damselae]